MRGNDFKAKCPQGVCLHHIIQRYKWKETGRAREKGSRVDWGVERKNKRWRGRQTTAWRRTEKHNSIQQAMILASSVLVWDIWRLPWPSPAFMEFMF